MSKKRPIIERFWNKIDIDWNTGCWNWIGGKSSNQYGYISVGQKNEGMVGSHQFAYEYFNNTKIPTRLFVCHSCDNKKCCAPHHLWLGTNKDNMHDASIKNRMTHGNRHYRAKLTDDKVRSIRSEYIKHDKEHNSLVLAKKYQVSHREIIDIIHRKIWKHVA